MTQHVNTTYLPYNSYQYCFVIASGRLTKLLKVAETDSWFTCWGWWFSVPICSMYGKFTYMWVIYGINVGNYSSTTERMGIGSYSYPPILQYISNIQILVLLTAANHHSCYIGCVCIYINVYVMYIRLPEAIYVILIRQISMFGFGNYVAGRM